MLFNFGYSPMMTCNFITYPVLPYENRPNFIPNESNILPATNQGTSINITGQAGIVEGNPNG